MSLNLQRRHFLMGCSSAIAALAGSDLRHPTFAAGDSMTETLVVVFLRGGWDALNIVPPVATGADRTAYEAARPTLRVPLSGTGAALPLDGVFGLHPALAPLHTLYQAQKLAIIHASGLNHDTRSHFDAQAFIELGTPGNNTTNSGWMARFLAPYSTGTSTSLPALAAGSSKPKSLQGAGNAVAISSIGSFNLGGSSTYRGQQLTALRMMYGLTADWLDQAGRATVLAIDLLSSLGATPYVPANGAVYPNTTFGNNLRLIAQLRKADLGMLSATVDLGGWDTHENEGDSLSMTTYLSQQLTGLANGLAAFYLDLGGSGSSNYIAQTTVVVMSEFGRRLKENANRGTDHGHGCVTLVLGGAVKGGHVYGSWPGLQNEQLYQRADLEVTTDYRRIFSEILQRRFGQSSCRLTQIFPVYTQESPLDFMEPGSFNPDPDKPYRAFLPLIKLDGTSPCP